MIKELRNLLDNFPGTVNQTRCFIHILNLVVKSILAQFDLSKAQVNVADKMFYLAEGLELEEDTAGKKEEEKKDDDNAQHSRQPWQLVRRR